MLIIMAQTQYQKAPLMKRCIASLIDGIILGKLFGTMDGINEGRGIGKGMMGIRTVKYDTGEAPSIGNSCIRNCCNLCFCLACVGEGRHVGDLIAGTIVIEDN